MAIIWAEHNVFTPPRFYLWKLAILECIQIRQLGLVNWRYYNYKRIVIVVMQARYAWYFIAYLHD